MGKRRSLFDVLDDGFDALDGAFDKLDGAFDTLDSGLDKVDDIVDGIVSMEPKNLDEQIEILRRRVGLQQALEKARDQEQSRVEASKSAHKQFRGKVYELTFHMPDELLNEREIKVQFDLHGNMQVNTDDPKVLRTAKETTKTVIRKIQASSGRVTKGRKVSGLTPGQSKVVRQTESLRTGKKAAPTRRAKITPAYDSVFFFEDRWGNRNMFCGNLLCEHAKIRIAERSEFGKMWFSKHPPYQVYLDDHEIHMKFIEERLQSAVLEKENEPSTVSAKFFNWELDRWPGHELEFFKRVLEELQRVKLNNKYHDEALTILNDRLASTGRGGDAEHIVGSGEGK